MNETPGQRRNLERFATSLRSALRIAGMTQTQLAESIGATQSMVSTWVSGKYEPRPEIVERIERSLDLAPADLSRHLGYLSIAYDDRYGPSVQRAIEGDVSLTQWEQQTLLAVYAYFRSGDLHRR